jgi:diguanylate cyclase (GGDEF)-like protein/PAS domain S-box-containing protein
VPDHTTVSLPRLLLAATVGVLTAREQQIVAALSATASADDAAVLLGADPCTFTTRLAVIATRLGLAGADELLALAGRSAVLDASPEGIYGIGTDGCCTFANARAAGMFGYRPSDMVGTNMHDLVHSKRADGSPYPTTECPIQRALSADRPHAGQPELFWHRDGTPVWVSYTVAPAVDAGEATGAVVTLHDMSRAVAAAHTLEVTRASLELALTAGAVITYRLDLATAACWTSESFEALVGLPPGGFAGTHQAFLDVVHPDDRSTLGLERVNEMQGGSIIEDSFRIIRLDGEERRVESRSCVLPGIDGTPAAIIGAATDVTERHDADEARRFLLQTSPDAFVGVDASGVVTEWNPAAEHLFGIARTAAIGQPMAEMIIPERFRATHHAGLARALSAASLPMGACGPLELIALRADGTEVPVEITLHTVPMGPRLEFRAFIRDISDRKEAEAALTRAAWFDPLTGLPNRLLLTDRLRRSIGRLDGTSTLAALVIDVDRLKHINDSLGHPAGDEALRAVAARLGETIGPADTLSRFNGDSFAVIAEGASRREALALARKLADRLAPPMVAAGREVRLTASIGIATAMHPQHSVDDLLRDADTAVLRAKQAGPGTIQLFDLKLRRRIADRLDLEAQLRRAIDTDELEVWYQPVMSIADERICGVEALVRWNHPARGLLGPVQFISLAEETGLIVPLGAKVLNTACTQAARWQQETGPGFTMAVNLSGRQASDPGLLDMVTRALADTGLEPADLHLEMTETALMEDTAATNQAIDRLHELGVHLSVDDFGTGYSSLLYLRRFPVKTLKLDRRFISGLGTDATDTAIVRATIDLAHVLGLSAHAEGVEEAEQLASLKAMGCDFAQGFVWSPAVPSDEISRMLDVAAPGRSAA